MISQCPHALNCNRFSILQERKRIIGKDSTRIQLIRKPKSINSSENKEKALKSFDFSAYYWSECRDSNSRPLEPHSSAIPNFATPGYLLVVSRLLVYISTPCRKMQALFLKNQKIFS